MERTTSYGRVVGIDESALNGAHAWKGLPFAKAPSGALRWRAPVEPDAWSTPHPAQQFGNPAIQTGRMYGPGRNNRHDRSIGESLGSATGSEDCLYLNIWAPADQSAPVAGRDRPAGLPVIVFIHGGSNITGYTADPMYDGARLAARARAVVVTVNYRLGIFGFLSLRQLRTGRDAVGDSGNFALLDIVKALEFVHCNIAAFGGDPSNVTLMGQSAGAVNLLSLLASPLLVHASPPLVHRAVPLSGGLSLPSDLPPGGIATLQPAAAREAQGQALLLHSLIGEGVVADEPAAHAWLRHHSDAEVAAWLRGVDAGRLLATVATRLAPLGLAGGAPIPDGAVLPLDPLAAIRAGDYLRVPLLCGITRDEGKLFPGALALSAALGGVPGRLLDDAAVFALQFDYAIDAPASTTIEQWIPAPYLPVTAPGTGFNARSELLTQLSYGINRDRLMAALGTRQDQLWHFRFDWDQLPAPFDAIYGAAHGFDVPFIFGNFGPSTFGTVINTRANQPGRLALSAAMMDSIAAFAAHGDPNHAGLGTPWPAWPASLLFDADQEALALSVVPDIVTGVAP